MTKVSLKSIRTLWVTFVFLLLGYILFVLHTLVIESSGDESLVNSFTLLWIAIAYGFFGYGLIIWPPVLLIIIVIELVLVKKETKLLDIKKLFFVEWLLISAPMLFFALTENYLLWFGFVFILGIGQVVRAYFLKDTVTK